MAAMEDLFRNLLCRRLGACDFQQKAEFTAASIAMAGGAGFGEDVRGGHARRGFVVIDIAAAGEHQGKQAGSSRIGRSNHCNASLLVCFLAGCRGSGLAQAVIGGDITDFSAPRVGWCTINSDWYRESVHRFKFYLGVTI